MNIYISKQELFSALEDLFYMPESDGTQASAQIRRDTKRHVRGILETVKLNTEEKNLRSK